MARELLARAAKTPRLPVDAYAKRRNAARFVAFQNAAPACACRWGVGVRGQVVWGLPVMNHQQLLLREQGCIAGKRPCLAVWWGWAGGGVGQVDVE